MPPEAPESYEPPESPKLRKTTVYKIVAVIILILVAYWLWKMYTHLPPAQPLQYPADYTPNTRVPPDVTVFTTI
jgi:hypothetical protein